MKMLINDTWRLETVQIREEEFLCNIWLNGWISYTFYQNGAKGGKRKGRQSTAVVF
jgi:hypothetical protein